MHRALFCLLASLLKFTKVASQLCDVDPLYPENGATAFIPFLVDSGYPFPQYNAMLQFSIQTFNSSSKYQLVAAMDTGSTGLAVSARDLGLTGTDLHHYPKGNEYLSSSRRLWEGHWIPSTLTFDDSRVVVQIPILAVTQNSTCRNFTNGSCPDKFKNNIAHWPTGIKYMGVGFGRGSDEQPQALPDKVPFTNVISIDDEPVNLHSGYILTKHGIYVGLTAENTASFKKTKLALRGNSTSTDWQMASMSISIDNSTTNNGSALFDTGINQSYVRVNDDIYQHISTEMFLGHKILEPHSVVTVLVGNGATLVGNYTVVANRTDDPLNPYLGQFIVEKPSLRGPFINTGRHFYNKFDAMLDAQCGWFGLRERTTGRTQSTESSRDEL